MENRELDHDTRPNTPPIALLIFTLVVLSAWTGGTIGRLPLAEAHCVARPQWPTGS